MSDFLTNKLWTVGIGSRTSSTCSTGTPKAVRSAPSPSSPYTHDCTPRHREIFEVLGRIHQNSNIDRSSHWTWITENNLLLNVSKPETVYSSCFIWQEIRTYQLSYQQTAEQLFPSGVWRGSSVCDPSNQLN